MMRKSKGKLKLNGYINCKKGKNVITEYEELSLGTAGGREKKQREGSRNTAGGSKKIPREGVKKKPQEEIKIPRERVQLPREGV